MRILYTLLAIFQCGLVGAVFYGLWFYDSNPYFAVPLVLGCLASAAALGWIAYYELA